MTWIGAMPLLLFAFQNIVFAKTFLVETGDEEGPPAEAINSFSGVMIFNFRIYWISESTGEWTLKITLLIVKCTRPILFQADYAGTLGMAAR